MIFQSKHDLLGYFKARNMGVLERQFNADGRAAPVMLDTEANLLLIATAPGREGAFLRTVSFPIHVSDLLGIIERDRLTAEATLASS